MDKELTEFQRGVRAMFDYFAFRAANNYHGNPRMNELCNEENKLIMDWARDALYETDEDSFCEWDSIVHKETLRNALDAAILALDVWTNITAPDFCNEARVAEAKARLNEHGTIWYIANVVQQCKEAKEYLK